MIRFIASRIGNGVLVLISVTLLICTIIYLAPVDPTRLTFGQRSDNQTVLQKQKELGLDLPLHQQMLMYLKDLSPVIITKEVSKNYHVYFSTKAGNKTILIKNPYLRYSYQSGKSVTSLLSGTIPKTIILALSAFVFAAIIGILLGVFSAIKKDSWVDSTILFSSTLGISVPSYVAAIFFAIVFGYLLAPYTHLNMQGSIFELNDIGDEVTVWKNLLLPALALGIRPISIITQLSRSALLDVLDQPYIKTARAKGLTFGSIILKHALKNAMNPIVTSLSGWLASLLAGAFFVEKVFNYKGVGELTINALVQYDIPVIIACILFICSVFIIINIINDIFYKWIDPKVDI